MTANDDSLLCVKLLLLLLLDDNAENVFPISIFKKISRQKKIETTNNDILIL
jgi:hypothetical protein